MSETSLALQGYEKELHTDPDGKGYVSKKGLARLCGTSRGSWGRGGRMFNERIDEALASKGFLGDRIETEKGIPDYVATLVIEYYAFDSNPTKPKARNLYRALAAIGLRTLIQSATGWRPGRRLTPEEIVEMCVLPSPTVWTRRFPEEYYDHLTRLTGLEAYQHKRPAYWAALTKELVYDELPSGIYERVNECKAETGGYDKVHQFLSEDGIQLFENHQRTLLTLMQVSGSLEELRHLLQNRRGDYQLILLRA